MSNIVPPEREGRTIGSLFTGSAVAGAISPVIIGAIGDSVGLRLAFALVAATTIIAALPVAVLFSNRVWVMLEPPRRSASAPGEDD